MAVSIEFPHQLIMELWSEEDVTDGTDLPEGFVEHAVLRHGDSTLLIPLNPRRSRGATPRRWTDSMSLPNVLARLAFGWALHTGVATPLLRHRVGIRATGGTEDHPTFHEYLASACNVDRVAVAATWGPHRPNRKPVLRIFDMSGETLGFAKVGWNPLTRELVSREARFLADAPQPHTMRLPGVIHVGTWRDRTISVTEPLLGSVPLRKTTRPGPEILVDLAGMSDRYRAQLSSSSYRAGLAARVGKLPAGDVAHALSLVDDAARDREVQFGHWHGDWTPWNMNSTGGHPAIWDWERTGGDMPVGFDAIHYLFHAALASGRTAREAITDAVNLGRDDLRALGIDPADIHLISLLYAIEMVARFAEQPVPWQGELLDTATALLQRI